MKILLLTRLYNPFTGGAATEYDFYFNNLIKMKKISKVDLITCKSKTKPYVEDINNNIIYRSIINFHNQNNIFLKFYYIILSILSSFVIFFKLILTEKKYDLIQIHSDFLFFKKGKYLNYSIYIFKFLAKKSILDIKDLSSVPKKDIGFDQYLVNSENTYKCIDKYISKKKIKLIYSPLIINRSNRNLSQKKHNILFLGSISKQKGINQLLSAMPLILREYPNAILNLYGEKIHDFDFNFNSYYHGPVTHQKALLLIQQCELIVLPSFSESLPRVILEGIYLKKKVLTSKCVPEFNRILNQFSLLDKINKSEISKKIIKLLKVRNIDKYKYDFTKHRDEVVINQIISLYEKLLK